MEISEINEISDAFSEAWRESFGQQMYLIRFLEEETKSKSNSYYNDVRETEKVYDDENPLPFYGTLRSESVEEKGDMYGGQYKQLSEIQFVTKELTDQGITEVTNKDIIRVPLVTGETRDYNIISNVQKVQFNAHRIFTKVKVEYSE